MSAFLLVDSSDSSASEEQGPVLHPRRSRRARVSGATGGESPHKRARALDSSARPQGPWQVEIVTITRSKNVVLGGSAAVHVLSGVVDLWGFRLVRGAGWACTHSSVAMGVCTLSLDQTAERGEGDDVRAAARVGELEYLLGALADSLPSLAWLERMHAASGPSARESPFALVAIVAPAHWAPLDVLRLPSSALPPYAVSPSGAWGAFLGAAPTRAALEAGAMGGVMIAGPQGAGKSTLARMVSNRALGDAPAVLFWDCDVGQPELSVAGTLAVHLLDAPLFGPPWTHLRAPLAARFVGTTALDVDPLVYLAAVRSLVDEIAAALGPRAASLPVVINTPGWVKGLGLELLVGVAALLRPAVLAVLSGGTARDAPVNIAGHMAAARATWPQIAFPLTDAGDERQPQVCVLPTGALLHAPPEAEAPRASAAVGLPAPERRQRALAAYFASSGRELAELAPVRVALADLTVVIAHASVPAAEVFALLNGALVGLAIAPPRAHGADEIVAMEMDSETGLGTEPAASLADERVASTVVAQARLVGLGLVRAVDPLARAVYIATPLSLAALADVDTLVVGELTLPAPMLARAATSEAPYVSSGQAGIGRVGTGASAMRSRQNLKRVRQHMP